MPHGPVSPGGVPVLVIESPTRKRAGCWVFAGAGADSAAQVDTLRPKMAQQQARGSRRFMAGNRVGAAGV
jgi:hypothetical protein